MKAHLQYYQNPQGKGKKATEAQLEKLKPKGLQQMLDIVDCFTELARVISERPARRC